MKIITSIFDLNKEIKDYKNIGFVPTMGGIHAGHISLIKASQNKKSKTIVSIFVNPTQFNKGDDFKQYPRNIQKDIAVLEKLNVEYLFTPEIKDIYKFKAKKFNLKKKDKILCAKYRKGHFEGVLDFMNRLMTIIKSKGLYMVEKYASFLFQHFFFLFLELIATTYLLVLRLARTKLINLPRKLFLIFSKQFIQFLGSRSSSSKQAPNAFDFERLQVQPVNIKILLTHDNVL